MFRTVKTELAIVFATVLIALLSGACDTKDSLPARNQITVTDMAGRRISVAVPVEKVVLGFATHLNTFAAIAGEDFLRKIAGFGLTTCLTEYDPDTYLKYTEKYPGIAAIPVVGSHGNGTFSVEKVISLKPDVVIFPLWLLLNDYEGTAEDIAKMERVGIKTIFIDYFEKPFENSIPSTLLLGALLGKEKRAQEIADFYQKRVNEVVGRLQKINKPTPKVYVESGLGGPSEYSLALIHTGCGGIAVKAGGINIAKGIMNRGGIRWVQKRWGQINPEYLLKTNPDVIIIAGPQPPSSMRSGYHANPEESRRLLKAFTERPGWNTLSAVKNGRVYGVFHFYLTYNIHTFAVIEAIAKWFHPDEFKDLDPEADLKEFYNKFMPIDYSGGWMIGIQD